MRSLGDRLGLAYRPGVDWLKSINDQFDLETRRHAGTDLAILTITGAHPKAPSRWRPNLRPRLSPLR